MVAAAVILAVDKEHHPEPEPGIGERPVAEHRPRQPEHDEGGQAGVVGVRVVRRGQRRHSLVGSAAVQQQRGRPDCHPHLGLGFPGRRQPAERGEHGTSQRGQYRQAAGTALGRGATAPSPRHQHDQAGHP
jgi:hypothetical protein